MARVDGVVCFVDMVPSSTCDPYVASVVRMGMTAADAHTISVVSETVHMQRLADHVKAGEWEPALKAYEVLPAALQLEQPVLLLRLAAASRVGGQALVDAVAAIRLGVTEPLCASLLAIDPQFTARDYRGVLDSVDALDVAVGGDPLLDMLRISSLDGLGQAEQAREAAARFEKNFPTIPLAQ